MNHAVVGVSVTELVKDVRRDVIGDHGRIVDVSAGVRDFDKRGVIVVADAAWLKLLGRKEIGSVARRHASFRREIDRSDVEDQLELAVQGRPSDRTADIGEGQFGE